MFTGLIEDIGTVTVRQKSGNSVIFGIESKLVTEKMLIGDSFAVNGVCLTIIKIHYPATVSVEATAETLQKTTLDQLTNGSKVNLERATKFGDRLGGHLVQGHVDGKGTIVKIEKSDNSVWFYIKIPPEFERYIVDRGSIAIDGISLTVADKQPEFIKIAVIPFTYKNTNLQYKNSNSETNIELDLIAKYIENIYNYKKSESNSMISEEWLRAQGYE